MFVPLQSSPPAQALPPHCTLKQSASCVTINTYAILEPPELADSSPSPAARKLREDLIVDCASSPSNARSRNQFKPTRSNKGTTSYQLRQFAEATLGSGSLRKAVKLPEGEDLNEWLAVNGMLWTKRFQGGAQAHEIDIVVDFYNQINLLYGSITEFCSPQSCPEMKATDEYVKL